MKLQRFFQVGESFFFGFTLAGDVDFETLGDKPVALSPYRCRKWAFHSGILSHPLLQQRPRFRLALHFFRRNHDRGGYLVALFEVEQLDPLCRPASRADGVGVDADDLAVLADDDNL